MMNSKTHRTPYPSRLTAHGSRVSRSLFIVHFSLFIVLLLAACRPTEKTVTIAMDGETITQTTDANTVGQLFRQIGIQLGDLDRVDPDLYVQLKPGMHITVTRVTEKTEVTTRPVPFEQKIVVNEVLPAGEQRIQQLGVNGEEEITTRITLENGVEVSRTEVKRVMTKAPVDEILIVGGKGSLPKVSFPGSIIYLSGGNAWLMKESTVARRLLTTNGDLDGHVFSVSPAGNRLLFTRTVSDTADAPLNELWAVDTRIVGEKPVSLPVTGVLYAEWSPLVTDTRIAYSTAERAPGQPGWRAKNDLWLWDTEKSIKTARRILPPNTRGLYSWWGSNFKWSPDGTKFAFATASQIGVIDAGKGTVTILKEFAPYQTHSEWAWVTGISWAPNSAFIATVVHGEPEADVPPEESQVFDVWLFAADGSISAKIAPKAGMWANPLWTTNGIIYGNAITPLHSVTSRYKLIHVDWDGSNPTIIFPQGEQPGVEFPVMAHPEGSNATVIVYQNDLYLLPDNGSPAQALTANHESGSPQWVIPRRPNIKPTSTPTTTQSITPTVTTSKGAVRENTAD